MVSAVRSLLVQIVKTSLDRPLPAFRHHNRPMDRPAPGSPPGYQSLPPPKSAPLSLRGFRGRLGLGILHPFIDLHHTPDPSELLASNPGSLTPMGTAVAHPFVTIFQLAPGGKKVSSFNARLGDRRGLQTAQVAASSRQFGRSVSCWLGRN